MKYRENKVRKNGNMPKRIQVYLSTFGQIATERRRCGFKIILNFEDERKEIV
jgi:hypothetical protein